MPVFRAEEIRSELYIVEDLVKKRVYNKKPEWIVKAMNFNITSVPGKGKEHSACGALVGPGTRLHDSPLRTPFGEDVGHDSMRKTVHEYVGDNVI